MSRYALSASLAAAAAGVVAEEGTMRAVFDELTRFGTHVPLVHYNEKHWEAITSCMATAGGKLFPTGSDAAWAGWTEFGIEGGSASDPWDIHNKPPGGHYKEYDPRNMTHKGGKIPIIEPCNTISNLAYYRIIPDLCSIREKLSMDDAYINAIVQGFATLGMGSSFMHGSRTQLGCVFDNAPIDVIAYQYFQYMNSPLTAPEGNSSVLHELSIKPRAYDGRQLAEKIHTIPLEEDVDNWLGLLKQLDRPQYFNTFAAIIVNSLTILLPDTLTDKIIPAAMSAFGLEADVKAFISDHYLPTIREATSSVHLTLAEKEDLLKKFAGTLLKLLYAFVWQEEIFQYKFVYNLEWNVLGALLMPSVNRLANRLTGFTHADDSIQKSESVYPGQGACKVKHTAPHAKWHEMSANGLMDLAYLSDHVGATIRGALGRASESSGGPTISTDVVESWASEVLALPSSEVSSAEKAFVEVVRETVRSMDACGGVGDGELSGENIACFVAGIASRQDFVNSLFKSISGKMDSEGSGAVHVLV